VRYGSLLKERLTLNGTLMHFSFPAKSGQRRKQVIEDPGVMPVVRALKRRRGGSPELLAFREDRRWVDVTSPEINRYLKGVAFFLGNTPSVARASYIDPRVLDRFQSGWTIAIDLRANEDPFAQDRRRRRLERAVIDLISDPRESPLVERR
jgi:DNA topoisomerase I